MATANEMTCHINRRNYFLPHLIRRHLECTYYATISTEETQVQEHQTSVVVKPTEYQMGITLVSVKQGDTS